MDGLYSLPADMCQLKTDYPDILQEFLTILNANDTKQSHSQSQLSTYNPAVYTTIRNFITQSLKSRRPIGSTVIFTAGATGAGKSKTLNNLIGIDEAFQTGRYKSTTKVLHAKRKPWNVHVIENMHLKANVLFVDVPGFSGDTEGQNKIHLESIKNFRTSIPELAERIELPPLFRQVYPNILLLLVHADEDKLAGENSPFVEILKSMRSLDLVDMERNNLIVALTHVMSVSNNVDEVCLTITRLKNIVKKLVWQYLFVFDVTVVSIENCPEKYVTLERDGDNYILPTKERNLQDLILQMALISQRNNDDLANFTLNNYCLKMECKINDIVYEQETTRKAMSWLNSRKEKIKEYISCSALTLGHLGHGYCPRVDQVKQICMVSMYPFKRVEINEVTFSIPRYVNVKSGESTETSSFVNCKTFQSKQDYEDFLTKRCNFDSDMKLKANFSTTCNWLDAETSPNSSQYIRFAVGLEVARAVICDQTRMNINRNFDRALNDLPTIYKEETSSKFYEFLAQWGTHVITEQSLGGVLYWDYLLDNIKKPITHSLELFCSQASQAYIVDTLRTLFNVSQRNPLENSSLPFKSASFRLSRRKNASIVELKHTDPSELHKWLDDVRSNPEEFGEVTKLEPCYNFLLVGPRATYLRQATIDYLAGESHLTTKRHTNTKSRYISTISRIRLYDDQDLNLHEKFPDKPIFISTIDIRHSECGDLTTVFCDFVASKAESCEHECVKIALENNVILVASLKCKVYKFYETEGYKPTHLRLCKINDIIGYLGTEVYLQPQRITYCSHIWVPNIVSFNFQPEKINIILNGIPVEIKSQNEHAAGSESFDAYASRT